MLSTRLEVITSPFFRTIDCLLHGKPEKCLPSYSSATEIANNFVIFFENKIINIRYKLEAAEMPDLFRTLDKLMLYCQLKAFTHCTHCCV